MVSELCRPVRIGRAVDPKRASGSSAARVSVRSGTTSRHCGFAGVGEHHPPMTASLDTHGHTHHLLL